MKLSHLNALRALEATLRCGTFSAAADELGVTVGAIGQQLRGLEDYLGLRLFDRLPSGVRPTVEAREVAEQLTMGFGAVDEALAQLRGSGHALVEEISCHPDCRRSQRKNEWRRSGVEKPLQLRGHLHLAVPVIERKAGDLCLRWPIGLRGSKNGRKQCQDQLW